MNLPQKVGQKTLGVFLCQDVIQSWLGNDVKKRDEIATPSLFLTIKPKHSTVSKLELCSKHITASENFAFYTSNYGKRFVGIDNAHIGCGDKRAAINIGQIYNI